MTSVFRALAAGLLVSFGSFASAATVNHQQLVANDFSGQLNTAVTIPTGSDLDAVQIDFVLADGSAAQLVTTAACSTCSTTIVAAAFSQFGVNALLSNTNYRSDVTISLLDAAGATVFSATEVNKVIASGGGSTVFYDWAAGLTFSSWRVDFGTTITNIGTSLSIPPVRVYATVYDVATVAPVPLPAGLPFLASGLGLIAFVRSRKRRRAV